MNYLLAHPARVAQLTAAHVGLVVAALAVALAVALPLGIVAARNPRVATPMLGVLGAAYTIPSLALLAVLVRFLGLGFLTVLVTLAAYGQFVLVRNIAEGLRGVPPAAIDAARGLGFTPAQSLRRVELPLAMPAILGGVRIAAVAMVSVATLGAYVGATDLGTLIFEGLAYSQNERIVAGAVCAMALAIAADLILRAVERRAGRGS